MKLLDKQSLRRLGAGESIAALCRSLDIDRAEFDLRWQRTIESRVPPTSGKVAAEVAAGVEIQRGQWGIPHIYARSDRDLCFGLGYAMAQDRLFQLDYLRRKGLGRLSEVLGKSGLEVDVVARTVGLNRIAAAEWTRLSAEVKSVLEAFAAGVNLLIEQSGDNLPIEFDLLDYRPEPWTPIDSLAIENEFRWYLTGRFPIIVMPELAKRQLGDGALYREYLLAEADEEPILWPGEYEPRGKGSTERRPEPVGHAVNDPDGAIGSNNWVLAGSRTTTGRPLLASDPHIAFEAVSCWYEAHLCGGSYNVAGMAYAGIPAIMFGRNERVAWGITNNICSLRDLYQERTSPQHPGCFEFDGQWEPARELTEVIQVRGEEPVSKSIRFSRNGPVVDAVLPAAAKETGPVTLKWLGAYQGGWLTSLLVMGRAKNVAEFREAVRPWHVPTFSLVVADDQGHIAFQAAGRIPVRNELERGYRPGWDPAHQWQGLLPFEEMPHVIDPQRGWIATANNRVAPDDFAHLLFGCWSSGHRAQRIRQMIEAQAQHSARDMGRMHQDAKSLRAAECVPPLVETLKASNDAQIRTAATFLENWDFEVAADSVPASLFNVFYSHWCKVVAAERFAGPAAELMAQGVQSCAGRLLASDPLGWFQRSDRCARIVETFAATLDELTAKLGTEMATWHWGRLHRLPLKHVLSSRGDLGQLLDHGGEAVRGDMGTVCNTGGGPDFAAASGAGYRLIADFSVNPPTLLAIDGQSQSGHAGSPHYRDQFADWQNGRYHEIPLLREPAADLTQPVLQLASRCR
ncbi:MAG: penicillin acylase family protein [Pirellulaceae bacterium]